MKFIATQRGIYNDNIIYAGEEFEAEREDLMATRIRDGKEVKEMCSWAVPATDYQPEPEKTPEEVQEDAREGLQGSKKTKKKASKKKVSKKVSKKTASKE